MSDAIARYIDHAVLAPAQTDDDLRRACRFCAELAVASVCVKPYMVPLAAELLAGSDVPVSTVIGFPHGSPSTENKAAEAEAACRDGAEELDMVINLGKTLAGDWDYVAADIHAVVEAGKAYGAITKVIFEAGLIDRDEIKIRLCEICEASDAEFVKTSTGFGFRKMPDGSMQATGATEHDIRLMRAHFSRGVKASGGIRTYQDARRFVELGATRLGASATEAICAQQRGEDQPEAASSGY